MRSSWVGWGLRLTALACVCMLAACNLPGKAKPQQKGATGSPQAKGLVTTPGSLPKDWPAELSPYPGATIVQGVHSQSGTGTMLKVELETKDTPDKVSDYYGWRAREAGYNLVSSSRVSNEVASVYQRDRLGLTVSARSSKGLTKVELTLVGVTLAVDQGAPDDPKQSAEGDSAVSAGGKAKRVGGSEDEPGGGEPEAYGHPLLPKYPGSKPRGGMQDDDGKLTLQLTTADSKEKVQDWYRSFYQSKGFKPETTFDLGTQLSASYTGPEGRVTVASGAASVGNNVEDTTTLIVLSLEPKALAGAQ